MGTSPFTIYQKMKKKSSVDNIKKDYFPPCSFDSRNKPQQKRILSLGVGAHFPASTRHQSR